MIGAPAVLLCRSIGVTVLLPLLITCPVAGSGRLIECGGVVGVGVGVGVVVKLGAVVGVGVVVLVGGPS